MFFRLFILELLETTLMAVLASFFETYENLLQRRQFKAQLQNPESLVDIKYPIIPSEFLLNQVLNGPTGIMYTTFFGLVLGEIINLAYTDQSYLYCNVFFYNETNKSKCS